MGNIFLLTQKYNCEEERKMPGILTESQQELAKERGVPWELCFWSSWSVRLEWPWREEGGVRPWMRSREKSVGEFSALRPGKMGGTAATVAWELREKKGQPKVYAKVLFLPFFSDILVPFLFCCFAVTLLLQGGRALR